MRRQDKKKNMDKVNRLFQERMDPNYVPPEQKEDRSRFNIPDPYPTLTNLIKDRI